MANLFDLLTCPDTDIGKTNPTFREKFEDIKQDWETFRRGFREPHKSYYDDLVVGAEFYRDAAGHQNPMDPMIGYLLYMMMHQQRRIEELEERLDD